MKKIIVLFSILVLVSSAFAQNPKSTGLTDSDVKSWAKNLKSIEREFDDAGISRDDVKSASKQEKAKAETILQKYGISAPNRIEKLAMINQCATLVMAENGFAGAGIDPNAMAMLKTMGVDPFAELKAKDRVPPDGTGRVDGRGRTAACELARLRARAPERFHRLGGQGPLCAGNVRRTS